MLITLALLLLLFAVPALAQTDFSGEWAPIPQPQRSQQIALGDWLGIPLNDEARRRAETWSQDIQTLPEWQCRPHGAAHITLGASAVKIWKEVDPVTRAITAFHVEWLRSVDNPVYLDGRPRPSKNAAHSWGGFSTGEWVGNMLKITTTHLKESYLERNGIPASDLATLTQYWIRNGDYLTWIFIVNDPVYLTEPFIRSTEYRLNLNQQLPPYPCDVVEEVAGRAKGFVPHVLPGANPALAEFTSNLRIPEQAIWAGAATLYPEFKTRLTGSSNALPPADSARAAAPSPASDPKTPLEVLHVRGPIYMVIGAGGNVTLSVGPDGVLVVDPGSAQMTDSVLVAIQQLQKQLALEVSPVRFGAFTRSTLEAERRPPPPPKPIRYIVNTHLHADHTGGNEKIAAAGGTLTGGNVAAELQGADLGASIYAHENVLRRMAKPAPGQPVVAGGALPMNTYRTEFYRLNGYFNGEGIQLVHQPAAHTDGDSIVWFRGADVIATGDLFSTTSYPVIDLQNGGGIQGIIDGLNRILDLAFPEFRTEGGTMIIPGHGRLADSADVAYYRDMVTIIHDRIRDMINKGMTLEQVKNARPTRGYDSRYGANTGSWTTDMFVEAVYRSLTAKK